MYISMGIELSSVLGIIIMINDHNYHPAITMETSKWDICISYSTSTRDLCDILHRSSRALRARARGLSAICRIDPKCTCYN